jgi:hypothetical protein
MRGEVIAGVYVVMQHEEKLKQKAKIEMWWYEWTLMPRLSTTRH